MAPDLLISLGAGALLAATVQLPAALLAAPELLQPAAMACSPGVAAQPLAPGAAGSLPHRSDRHGFPCTPAAPDLTAAAAAQR